MRWPVVHHRDISSRGKDILKELVLHGHCSRSLRDSGPSVIDLANLSL